MTSGFVCYQFRQAPFGEDPTGAGEMQVSGDPAAHVEPLSSSRGWRPVLPVQQNQLFLSPDCTSFQHPLQLETQEVCN